jgi:hypothetical protein
MTAMTEQQLKLVMTMAYGSVYSTLPMANNTQTYWIGKMTKGGFKSLPSPEVQVDALQLANDARNQGYKLGKIDPTKDPVAVTCQPVDLVPFYLGMGKALISATPGVTFETNPQDFRVSLAPSGDVPAVYWHREDNRILGTTPANCVRDYYKTKCTKLNTYFENDFLTTDLEFLVQKSHATSTVFNLLLPTRRGDKSPAKAYPRKHLSHSIQWIATATHEITPLFRGFSFSVEAKYSADLEEDTYDYAADLDCHGEFKVSDIIVEVAMDPTSVLLGTLRALINGTEGSATDKYLKIKLARQHANDYIEFHFNNVILKKIEFPVNQSQVAPGYPVAKLIYSGESCKNIQVWERQSTSAGAANNNAAATYESVSAAYTPADV